MKDRQLTANAADAKSVRTAERLERRRAARFRDALASVMNTPTGRAVMWGLLERAGIYRSVWDNSSRIHYNAGRQDFGHEILAALVALDDKSELYLTMEREARVQMARDNAETDAAQIDAAPKQE